MGAPEPDPRPPWPRETPLFWATYCIVRAVLRTLFRFRVEGLEHYPGGPAVIVANHPSALDALFLAAALPERVLYIGAEEFLAMPGVGWAMRTYGCIPVRRGEVDLSAIREALRALRDGRKVVVFPEGRVSPEPGPLHRGAALIAARAAVAIVPVAIAGTARVFPLGARVPRPAPVRVRFGPPHPPPREGRGELEAAVAAAMAWVRTA
jgi:1-acyl-sn-glycerol-3-phosphate acyltransferase